MIVPDAQVAVAVLDDRPFQGVPVPTVKVLSAPVPLAGE
jgi:hypothetical protein